MDVRGVEASVGRRRQPEEWGRARDCICWPVEERHGEGARGARQELGDWDNEWARVEMEEGTRWARTGGRGTGRVRTGVRRARSAMMSLPNPTSRRALATAS